MQQQHGLIVEDDRGRWYYALNSPIHSVGGDSKCDIRLVSQVISPCCATLMQQFSDDGIASYRIVDGKPQSKSSPQGLLINGHRVWEHALQHEDEIIFCPGARAVYQVENLLTEEELPQDTFTLT